MHQVLLVMMLLIKYSFYNPALGGTNCSQFVEGNCVSTMASGYRWQDWMDRAVACPKEWEFGTTVELNGKIWTCMDRGGKIRFGEDGYTYVDFLTTRGAYRHGTLVEVKITPPALNITGGVMAEDKLFVRQILRLNSLGTHEVNSPQRQHEICPGFKSAWELGVPELCIQDIQSYTNQHAYKDSQKPLDSSNRNANLSLEEISENPIHCNHRQCFRDKNFQYIFQ